MKWLQLLIYLGILSLIAYIYYKEIMKWGFRQIKNFKSSNKYKIELVISIILFISFIYIIQFIHKMTIEQRINTGIIIIIVLFSFIGTYNQINLYIKRKKQKKINNWF